MVGLEYPLMTPNERRPAAAAAGVAAAVATAWHLSKRRLSQTLEEEEVVVAVAEFPLMLLHERRPAEAEAAVEVVATAWYP